MSGDVSMLYNFAVMWYDRFREGKVGCKMNGVIALP
jgi:hypothetical protein